MLWHPVQKLTQFNRVQNFHFGNEIVINKQTAQVRQDWLSIPLKQHRRCQVAAVKRIFLAAWCKYMKILPRFYKDIL